MESDVFHPAIGSNLGSLDSDAIQEARAEILKAFDAGSAKRAVIIDLSGVHFGGAALLGLMVEAWLLGAKFQVSEFIERLVKIAGLSRLLAKGPRGASDHTSTFSRPTPTDQPATAAEMPPPGLASRALGAANLEPRVNPL